MSEEAGWYPDPYFLGHERYWDGGAWTEHCRSAGTKADQRSVRPPLIKNPELSTPSALAARALRFRRAGTTVLSAQAAGVGAVAAGTGTATLERPAPMEDEPGAPATTTATVTAPDAPAPPAAGRPTDARAYRELVAADPAAYNDGFVPRFKAPRPRWQRRLGRFVVAASVIVLLAGLIGVIVLKEVKKHKVTPAATQVAEAAISTDDEQYAQVDVGLQPDANQPAAAAAGITGFSATGTVHFGPSQGSFTVTGPGSAGTAQMVLDGQTIYLQPGTLVSQLVPGKPWVSATANDLGSVPSSGFVQGPDLFEQLFGGAIVLLQQLTAPGDTAMDLGASTYQGSPVEEYSVQLSPDAVNARSSALPASLVGVIANDDTTEKVYVSNGVVRAIVLPVSVTANGATATGQATIGYSAWGLPATITVPPAGQVVGWAQLKQVLTYTSGLP